MANHAGDARTAIDALEAEQKKLETTVALLARNAVEAEELLMQFCDRYYWITAHADFQDEVRTFLTAKGYSPNPVGNKVAV